MSEAHSKPNQTWKAKISAKIAIGLTPLTVFARSSIPEGWVRMGWALKTPPDATEYEIFCQPIYHSSLQISLTTLKQRSELCLTPPKDP